MWLIAILDSKAGNHTARTHSDCSHAAIDQGTAHFFCKRAESKYFRLCRPYIVSVVSSFFK